MKPTSFLIIILAVPFLWWGSYYPSKAFDRENMKDNVRGLIGEIMEQMKRKVEEVEEDERKDIKPLRKDRDIYEIQSALKELGFYKGRVDGIPNDETDNAIDNYLISIGKKPKKFLSNGEKRVLIDRAYDKPDTKGYIAPLPRAGHRKISPVQ